MGRSCSRGLVCSRRLCFFGKDWFLSAWFSYGHDRMRFLGGGNSFPFGFGFCPKKKRETINEKRKGKGKLKPGCKTVGCEVGRKGILTDY